MLSATRIAAALAVGVLASGCGLRERVCADGEHPVRSISAPESGRTCVRDGRSPPEGYEEFPPGQEPEYADEVTRGQKR